MNSLKDILVGVAHIKYSEDDWGNDYEIRKIISAKVQIEDYFVSYDFNSQFDIDMVSDYYLISKICLMESLQNRIINDEIRTSFGEIINFCGTIKEQFPIRNLIAFYNTFSFDIDSKYLRMRQAVYNEIPQYYNAIQEDAYKKAFLQCPYLIFEKYKDYKKVFKEYPSLEKIIFSDENISCYISGPNSHFIAACIIAVNSSIISDTTKIKIINSFKSEAKNIINCQDIKMALQNQIRYKALIGFLYEIKDPEFSSLYQKKQKEIDNRVIEYLDKYGQKLSIPIPFADIVKRLDNPDISKAIKQVELSHMRDDKIKELSHFSVFARDISQDSILDDLVCTATDTNENFKMSMQNSIASFHQFYMLMYQYYLGDTHFNDYAVMQRNFLKFVYDELRLNFFSIVSQIGAWENKVKEYIEDISTGNNSIDLAINCLEKTILLTERILKDVYCSELDKKKVFYNLKGLTLGAILKSDIKDNPLLEILGEEHLKYLEYTLISNVDKKGLKVGLNLRNICMHSAYDWDEFEISNTMISIIVFTGMVNAFFLHYNKIASLREHKRIEKKKRIDSVIAKQERLLQELKQLECDKQEAFRELQEQIKKLNLTTIFDLLKKNDINEEDMEAFLKDKKVGITKELQVMIGDELRKSNNYDDYINALRRYDIFYDIYVQKLLGYYSEILKDKNELFSKEYNDALDLLADQGFLFYFLRTPDIDEEVLFNENNLEIIVEQISLQLRNTYRDFYDNSSSPFSDNIIEIIELFEDNDYNKCAKKIIEILNSLIPETSKIAIECKNDFKQFEYYFDKIECCKELFDKITCPLKIWDKKLVNYYDVSCLSPTRPANKKDCVQLLLLFDNAHELTSVIMACSYIKNAYKRRNNDG